MSTLVPPIADVTLELDPATVPGPVFDAGRSYVAGLIAGARSGRPVAALPADGQAGLLAAAGERALRRPRDVCAALRGLCTLLSSLGGDDSAVRLRPDGVTLRAGSAEVGADVLAAAAAPAPYDEELKNACADAAAAPGPVRVVLERDQQLPAGLAALGMLREAGAPVEITGRYATTHWARLVKLPPLAGARLVPAPRGMSWNVTGVPGDRPPGPPVSWHEAAADPLPPGAWAGRVSLHDLVTGNPALDRARVVVLGICAAGEEVIGRGGTRARRQEVAAAVTRLRESGTRCVTELWLGAPGIDADRARSTETVTGPIVGLRVFAWPVDWDEPAWAGAPVRLAPRPGCDLPRHLEVLDPPVLDPPEVSALIAELGGPLARSGRLVPARNAAAYLWPGEPLPETGGDVVLDPDAILLSQPEMIAVNVRTGRCTRIPRPAAKVLAGAATGQRLTARLGERAVAALLARDVLSRQP